MNTGPVKNPPNPTDQEKVHKVELLISNILRIGVLLSLSIIVVGMLISYVRHPQYLYSHSELARLTQPGAAFPETLGELMEGLRQGQGRAVVVVGLLVLIATPVVRVAVSVLTFIYQKDRTFVILTLIVLGLLILSFFLGKVEG